MKNKKRLVPWLIAAVIIAALAVIGKKLYDLMFGGSLAVTTEDLKNGIIACSPAIIFIVVVLIAALIVVVAAGKLKQPKRALVRAQAPIAILLAITLSVNWVILGVEYSVVNSVFAEDVKVSDETMASGRAIADQIASEGIVLLKNDDKALPLSAGTKLNLFGWSSVRPLYGGTGSGDSDTSNAVSLIDGLKHAGFEVNEELVKFYENFRTERPVGTIRLREIGSKRGDFTVPEPTIAEYENANIFEDAVGMDESRDAQAVLWLVILTGVDARDDASGLDGFGMPTLQNGANVVFRKAVRHAQKVHRHSWLAAHGVHVAQRVRRGDLAEEIRIIHNGGEEVDRLNDGDLVGDAVHGGVVTAVVAD